MSTHRVDVSLTLVPSVAEVIIYFLCLLPLHCFVLCSIEKYADSCFAHSNIRFSRIWRCVAVLCCLSPWNDILPSSFDDGVVCFAVLLPFDFRLLVHPNVPYSPAVKVMLADSLSDDCQYRQYLFEFFIYGVASVNTMPFLSF